MDCPAYLACSAAKESGGIQRHIVVCGQSLGSLRTVAAWRTLRRDGSAACAVRVPLSRLRLPQVALLKGWRFGHDRLAAQYARSPLAAVRNRVGAALQDMHGGADAEGNQSAIDVAQRQTHYVGIASLDPLDGVEGSVLDGISSGFVQGITAGYIVCNLFVGVFAHHNGGSHRLGDDAVTLKVQDR